MNTSADSNMVSRLFRTLNATHVAIGCCFIWYIVFSYFRPSPFVDESVHQDAIIGIHEGKIDFSGFPSLPAARNVGYGPWAGYHWTIAIISRLPGPSVSLSRFLTFVTSAAMIALYASVPWQQSGLRTSRSPLLLALLPILFPYTAMVYTDVLALFFIIGAIYLHAKISYALAAISMLLACLVRQTNILWVLYIVARSALGTWDLCKKESALANSHFWSVWVRHLLPQVLGYIVVIGLVVTLFISSGQILTSGFSENRAQPNSGNFYTLAFFALMLWAPIWFERAGNDVRSIVFAARRMPVRVGFLALILAAFGFMLISRYDNWHPWNWTPMALRNIPLILMDRYVLFRVIAVTCVFFAVWFVARFWSSQSNNSDLILLAFFAFLFLSAHPVVEPRYLIVPFVLSHFFVDYSNAQVTKLALWYISINVIICILIASGLAIW